MRNRRVKFKMPQNPSSLLLNLKKKEKKGRSGLSIFLQSCTARPQQQKIVSHTPDTSFQSHYSDQVLGWVKAGRAAGASATACQHPDQQQINSQLNLSGQVWSANTPGTAPTPRILPCMSLRGTLGYIDIYI